MDLIEEKPIEGKHPLTKWYEALQEDIMSESPRRRKVVVKKSDGKPYHIEVRIVEM